MTTQKKETLKEDLRLAIADEAYHRKLMEYEQERIKQIRMELRR